MGRQCQIKTMMPSIELIPPTPATTLESQEAQDLADKPSIEEASKEESPTAEPLGPIVITDPPMEEENITATIIITTTVNSAATAGKWPPGTTTVSTERDDENET